jgi:hypothetical protein
MAISDLHAESPASVRDRRMQWLGLVGACACASVPLYFADPAKAGFFPRCPIHSLTGLYCPGCGTTRAMHQLLHGNPGAAMRFNPLALVLLPVLAYSFLSFTLEVFRGKALPRLFRTRTSTWMLIAAVIAFTVLRNIPAHPFSLLAPRKPTR